MQNKITIWCILAEFSPSVTCISSLAFTLGDYSRPVKVFLQPSLRRKQNTFSWRAISSKTSKRREGEKSLTSRAACEMKGLCLEMCRRCCFPLEKASRCGVMPRSPWQPTDEGRQRTKSVRAISANYWVRFRRWVAKVRTGSPPPPPSRSPILSSKVICTFRGTRENVKAEGDGGQQTSRVLSTDLEKQLMLFTPLAPFQ